MSGGRKKNEGEEEVDQLELFFSRRFSFLAMILDSPSGKQIASRYDHRYLMILTAQWA